MLEARLGGGRKSEAKKVHFRSARSDGSSHMTFSEVFESFESGLFLADSMIRWVDRDFYQFSNSPNHDKLILIWEIWGLW